jgi:hypothetical protein
MKSVAPKRRSLVESIMVAVYFVMTAYLLLSNSRPSAGLMFYEAVRPFQIRARARNAAAERTVAVWSLQQSQIRVRRRAGENPGRQV